MATTPLQLSNWNLADVDSPGSAGSDLNTGVLRRKYNFGDRVSELAIAQTPFFRFLSKVGKNPTDDPSFKFTERRPSFHKRYAYVVGYLTNTSAKSFDDATLKTTSLNDGTLEQGDEIALFMAGDYYPKGNIQNVYGQASGEIKIGAADTAPNFFLKNQIIKIPVSHTAGGGAPNDYVLARISAVAAAANETYTPSGGSEGSHSCVKVTANIVSSDIASGKAELTSMTSNAPYESAYNKSISGALESYRTYVVGSAYGEGSQLANETWNDQPFSTGYGQTQIWRTEFGMTNTARATVLKYEANEWARIWREKLIEHKWDVEQSLLFGSQASVDSVGYTQGAIDFIVNNGNIFSMDLTTKSQDSFLDDLSSLVDPRYNDSQATVFFCSTAVYNWLHKLSGYFSNNVGMVQPGSGNTTPSPADASLGRTDFALMGKSKSFGVDISRISTLYGDMNVARHVMLDGTDVKMVGINMKHCKYRPLVGNGVSRDTSVYVGVQSLENTGTDKRVDMILTEAGMEWQMPEAHAIWK
jgi:hypothetical protein